jgi:hypothetical protein
MMSHPLVPVVGLLDLVAVGLALGSAPTALRVVVDWDAARADAAQLRLEGRSEAAAVAWAWAAALALAAGGLLVAGIGLWLPAVVPGAMCGTGVLQAAGAAGPRALTLRLAALLVLWGWRTVEDLNRRLPEGDLTPLASRLQLAALPVLVLAAMETQRALATLAGSAPVDCCVVVYDQAAAAGGPAQLVSDAAWLAGFGLLSLILLALAGRGALGRGPAAGSLALTLAAVAGAWAVAAHQALTGVLAAYHYQVLQHRCPWCLMLPEHKAVGWPLYAALLVVLLEAVAGIAAAAAGPRHPALAPAARARFRRACRRMAAAAGLFAIIAALPALVWRLRHGLWL